MQETWQLLFNSVCTFTLQLVKQWLFTQAHSVNSSQFGNLTLIFKCWVIGERTLTTFSQALVRQTRLGFEPQPFMYKASTLQTDVVVLFLKRFKFLLNFSNFLCFIVCMLKLWLWFIFRMNYATPVTRTSTPNRTPSVFVRAEKSPSSNSLISPSKGLQQKVSSNLQNIFNINLNKRASFATSEHSSDGSGGSNRNSLEHPIELSEQACNLSFV